MNGQDEFATFDAAYVLGALSPQERADFEAHLQRCEACARSVRELAGLPGLLGQAQVTVPQLPGRLGGEQGARPQPPPESLLPALAARVAAERRRRARRAVLVPVAAVALAACLALVVVFVPGVGGGGGGGGDGDGGGRQAPALSMTSLVDYPVEGTVSLSDTEWGTRVDVECMYGARSANEYVLVAITGDGETRELSRWVTVPDHAVSMSVGTALRQDDIERLEVRSTHGYPVLRLDLRDIAGGKP